MANHHYTPVCLDPAHSPLLHGANNLNICRSRHARQRVELHNNRLRNCNLPKTANLRQTCQDKKNTFALLRLLQRQQESIHNATNKATKIDGESPRAASTYYAGMVFLLYWSKPNQPTVPTRRNKLSVKCHGEGTGKRTA